MLWFNQRIIEENMMILFTSDLDRTLIYSKRMMEMFPPATETIVVEHKVETAMSMMTQVTAPYCNRYTNKLYLCLLRQGHYINIKESILFMTYAPLLQLQAMGVQ